jgi:diguanylate cyclase (GGDEF)-like protein/PAS domain S-box-containing protein
MSKKPRINPVQDTPSHSRDLLLALSRAAQSVQRARTTEEVYRAVGSQIKSLGGEVFLLMLHHDRQSLIVAYTSFAKNVVRRVEKITGDSIIGYRFELATNGSHARKITTKKTLYVQSARKYIALKLPKTSHVLVEKLISVLKIEQGIFAPLRVDDEILGLMIVSGLFLSNNDVPAMDSFAGQIAVSLSNVRLAQRMQNKLAECKKVDEELRENESQLRVLFEQMAVGVARIQTQTGKFVQVNQKYCDIIGYSRSEMESLDFQSITHPDDLQADLDNMELLKRGAIRNFTMEKRYFHKNGSVVWVELTVSSMWVEGTAPDFHIAIVRDITARKQAEEQSLLQNIALEAAANAIAITDKKGAIQWVNPAWVELTGYSKEETIGQNPRIIKSEAHDSAFYKDMWNTILSGEVWRGELVNRRKNGSLYFEEETITPVLDRLGNVKNFIAIKLDITERKQAEIKLQQLAHTDSLTGVNNRRRLFELAEHEFDVARRYQHSLSVIMFDLDHFKFINDSFGHATGDQVLERVVAIARAQLRDVDLIGRYGGEEFVIVLPLTGAKQAYLLAERIRTGVAALKVETGGKPAFVTLSMGIAEMTRVPQDESVENIIRRADEAMYAAKRAGRNRVVIFEK